jgi:hypothetical protein
MQELSVSIGGVLLLLYVFVAGVGKIFSFQAIHLKNLHIINNVLSYCYIVERRQCNIQSFMIYFQAILSQVLHFSNIYQLTWLKHVSFCKTTVIAIAGFTLTAMWVLRAV